MSHAKDRYIFLDIDGVITSFRSAAAGGGYPWPGSRNEDWEVRFDKVAISLIRRLIRDYDLKVVLSSTWRMHPECHTRLQEFLGINFHSLTGVTGNRVTEIKTWLEENNATDGEYLIIDDVDFGFDLDHFIEVDATIGFSYYNYKAAQAYFNGGIEPEDED